MLCQTNLFIMKGKQEICLHDKGPGFCNEWTIVIQNNPSQRFQVCKFNLINFCKIKEIDSVGLHEGSHHLH